MTYKARKTITLFARQYLPEAEIPQAVIDMHHNSAALIRSGHITFEGPAEEDPNSIRSTRALRAKAKAEVAPEPVAEAVQPEASGSVSGAASATKVAEPVAKKTAKKAPAKKTAKKAPAKKVAT